ncbi:MAG: VirB8/TrbF family protein, partial [Burkholderiales bacterium]
MASSKKSANLSKISRDELLEKLKSEKLIEAKGNELFLTKQGEVILNEEASQESSSGIKNPFLEGKREWDLRYGSTIDQNHRLWLSNFVSWIITVLALVGMYSIAHQNHVEPIFFAVDKIGRIIATGNPTSKIKVNQDM